jgi:hypothetical protein
MENGIELKMKMSSLDKNHSRAPSNKRMQTDRSTRYASKTAADARRYVARIQE